MEKITITIETEFDENDNKFEIRFTGTPDPETLGTTYAKNIRAILMLASSQAINSTFKKVGGETKMNVEVTK